MIELSCGNCGQTLRVDDAFAGGVCRCNNCGTIQTVPSESRVADNAGSNGQPAGSPASRPLYRREDQDDQTSGLDELADVVASSGAMSSGLSRASRQGRGGRRGRSASSSRASLGNHVDRRPAPPPDANRKLRIAIAAAALFGTAAILLAILLVRQPEPAAMAEEGPTSLLGDVELPGAASFAIDTGSATADLFRPASLLAVETARQLPAGGRYQLILWPAERLGDERLEASALPARQLRPATQASLDAVVERLRDVEVGGSTRAGPAVTLALEAGTEAIVLMTGNTAFLPERFADDVIAAWNAAGAGAPIHTVALGTDEVPDALADVAERTGGTARAVTRPDIRRLRRQIADGEAE